MEISDVVDNWFMEETSKFLEPPEYHQTINFDSVIEIMNRLRELRKSKQISFVSFQKQMKRLRNLMKRRLNREIKFYNTKTVKYDVYYPMLDPENYKDIFYKCRVTVPWKRSYQTFNLNLVRDISDMWYHLLNGNLNTLPHDHFKVNERGKIRVISAPEHRERFIQSNLCTNIVHPLIDSNLIKDNYACQKNKGVKFARKRFKKFMIEMWKLFQGKGYSLKVDIHHFFDSTPHKLIMKLLKKFIKNTYTLDLIKQIIDKKLDLNGKKVSKGLCLGSELSQITAILFLSNIDHNMKEQKRLKFYGRYNDDFGILHRFKKILKEVLIFLRKELRKIGLILNSKKTKITSLSRQGLKILKVHYIYDKYKNRGKVIMLSGRESAKRERRKLRKFNKKITNKEMTFTDVYNCYKGWRKNILKSFNAYNMISKNDEYFKHLFNIKFVNFRYNKVVFNNYLGNVA